MGRAHPRAEKQTQLQRCDSQRECLMTRKSGKPCLTLRTRQHKEGRHVHAPINTKPQRGKEIRGVVKPNKIHKSPRGLPVKSQPRASTITIKIKRTCINRERYKNK
ncbi:hypothetical protein NDU88_002764 [Pleurodeles waltl]|uniref:Uncharacterized protein n=1 Tax=Pleurodeles waltl TaxID=8319 RepID=A0AAV7MPA1_PLEWA|nr:hypothetical protein NDU88_002764 [Pleurodeles waltl]